MKYVAKTVNADLNLPQRHPLVDLTWMAGGLSLILAVLFIGSGFIVDFLARYVPQEYDNNLSNAFPTELYSQFGAPIQNVPLVDKTQALFEQLKQDLPEDDIREYKLSVLDSDEVNAFAVPGGHIVVFRGLLEQAESENEVAMVLAHEFGHIYHRHHWRRLGRAAIFAFGSMIIGTQSSLQNQLTTMPLTTLMQANSRGHESESDRFALNMICRHYGHFGGAVDFFARNGLKDSQSIEAISFLLTHPVSKQRIADIQHYATDIQCSDGSKISW